MSQYSNIKKKMTSVVSRGTDRDNEGRSITVCLGCSLFYDFLHNHFVVDLFNNYSPKAK